MTALQILRHMRQVKQPDQIGLTEIFKEEVNLVIWQRCLAKELYQYADQLVAKGSAFFSALQAVVTPAELADILRERLPDESGKELLMSQKNWSLTCQVLWFGILRSYPEKMSKVTRDKSSPTLECSAKIMFIRISK